MKKEKTSLEPTNGRNLNSPAFIEAEKMFERVAETTKETAKKAFDCFQERGMRFGSHLEDWLKAELEVLRPVPVEIAETIDDVSLQAAVPGFKADEIEISVDGKMLTIVGETKSEAKKEDETVYYSEFRSNRFCRQLPLPVEVETDNVGANLKDGILRLTLKKKAAHEEVKIAVATAGC